jgi:hypothetical protein
VVVLDPETCRELFREELPDTSVILTIVQNIDQEPTFSLTPKANLAVDEVLLEPKDPCP